MHIGIEGHGFWKESGSQTRYVYQLICALARLDRSNRYTIFFNSLRQQLPGQAWFRDLLKNPNFSYVMTRVPNTGFPWLKHLLSRIAWPALGRHLGIKLFHSTAYRCMYAGRTPSILTVHDLAGIIYPEYFPDTRIAREQNRALVRATQRANIVLASSQNTRDDICQLKYASPDRVRVVTLGVDERQFRHIVDSEEIEQVKRRYKICGPYILHVGDLVPRKNLTRLIQVFARLKTTRRIPHQLVLVGKRNYGTRDLFEIPRKLGVESDVHFPGFAAEDHLPALYSGAAVFAYPSFYEGFGLPLLEAMACGVPIVCSNASSLVEVVGDAAIVLDPTDDGGWYDALDLVIRNGEVGRDLIRRGLLRVKEFSWDRTAAETLAVYRELGAA